MPDCMHDDFLASDFKQRSVSLLTLQTIVELSEFTTQSTGLIGQRETLRIGIKLP